MKLPSVELTPNQVHIYTTINSYMNGASSIEHTSSLLAKPTEADYSNGGHTSDVQIEGYTSDDPYDILDVNSLYLCVIRYARTISWDDLSAHLRLIALLDAFWARPEPPSPPGEDGPPLWHSGCWVGTLTDEWQYGPNSDLLDSTQTNMATQSEEWTNMNAFLAYFTKSHNKIWWRYGFDILRDVLEPDDFERPDIWCDGVGLDVFLPSAAVWMLVSGDLVWDATKGPEEAEAKDRMLLEEMSLQRWEIWKTEFQQIANGETGPANEKTRQLARDAAIRMEMIESQEG